MKTAILVDGDFYLRRHYGHFGAENASDPNKVADDFWIHCIKHIHLDKDRLYRIFFYDCPPLSKKLHHPLTGRAVDLSKTPTFAFRNAFHAALIQKRNVALRLGYLDQDNGQWRIKDAQIAKKVIAGALDPKSLDESQYYFHAPQKCVDMKIGLDIASLAYKKLVDRIVLITGDSDFVPAAKLARMEGMEVVLDPMRHHIKLNLQEHIDGLNTTLPKPTVKKQEGL